MTSDNPRRKEEVRRVLEQAAEWFTLFEGRTGSAEERAAFAGWMRESPLHVRAFLNVSALDRMVGDADLEGDLEPVETRTMRSTTDLLVFQSREQRTEAAVIRPSRASEVRRWIVPGTIAAAILLAVAIVGVGLPQWATQRYVTGTGEQRSIELADGSIVHLNAKSHLTVRIASDARELQLLEGEALFDVQQDPQQPFRVQVGGSVVQAIGTQFDIDRRADRTTVSVLEGVVQVSNANRSPASAGGSARLVAGESVRIVSQGTIGTPRPVNKAQVTAWRQRQLVFNEDTLADIATEFNRYNRVPQLRIEGESVRQRRYAAVFDADDPQPLLRFLAKDPALQFENRGETLIIRAR